MSADDPTLPGRPSARGAARRDGPYRNRAPSACTLRVVGDLRKTLDTALTQDGALREHALEAALEVAIDAGAKVSQIQLDALRQQVTDLQGRNADLEQTLVLKDEKILRLERALKQANERIARAARTER